MKPSNLLIIMSDQHNPKALGHAGHPVVKTPNLDRLAERGTRFTSAYTQSPLCMPARAAFATGRYVHETRHWDNASPYSGSVPAWGHRLMERGFYVRAIGKLHYRSASDPNGFTDIENAMYAVEGSGDLQGCIRDELPLKAHSRESIENAGRGESSYTRYDDDITAATVRWLREDAAAHERPWTVFCSLVCPHPPKRAPGAFFDLYPLEDVPWPVQATAAEGWTMHPAPADYRRAFRWDAGYEESTIRRALAAYLGQITFLDDNVGKVLQALDEAGLAENTRVIYTTDHGDNMGNRGLWNKNTMYEDSAGVPLIMRGPEIPAGQVIDEPATHLDVFPTVLASVGCEPTDEDLDLPGTCLLGLANGDPRPRPVLLSQFHGSGTSKGAFIIRKGAFKYIYHAGWPAELYDLAVDPDELDDLATKSEHAAQVRACEAELRALCDPDAIDAQAHADQEALIAAHGGREAVMARGSYNGSPVPGESAQFQTFR